VLRCNKPFYSIFNNTWWLLLIHQHTLRTYWVTRLIFYHKDTNIFMIDIKVLLITFPSAGRTSIFGKIFVNGFSIVLCCPPLLTLHRYVILSNNCHWSLPISLLALQNPQELQHPINNPSVVSDMRLHAKGKHS